MEIKIVILNWNGRAHLERFLPSVVSHSTGASVVVADNGSDDDSAAFLRKHYPQVELLLLDKNYGYAEGYNRALEQVAADCYVLLNSDVEVEEGWLGPLAELMASDERIAALAPKILSYDRPGYFEYAGASGGFLDAFGYPFCRGRILDTIEQDDGQYDTSRDVFWASGACMMVRADVFRKLGGFDGDFFAHMEEIDLCWRLRSRGRGIVCIPQSVVYHVGAATLKKESPRKTFLNFRNNLVMLYKNLHSEELSGVMRVRTILDYVAAFQFLLKGQFGNAKAVLHARKEYKRLRSYFSKAREENLRKTYVNPIPEQIKNCILWQFYAKGRKRFSQLSNFKG